MPAAKPPEFRRRAVGSARSGQYPVARRTAPRRRYRPRAGSSSAAGQRSSPDPSRQLTFGARLKARREVKASWRFAGSATSDTRPWRARTCSAWPSDCSSTPSHRSSPDHRTVGQAGCGCPRRGGTSSTVTVEGGAGPPDHRGGLPLRPVTTKGLRLAFPQVTGLSRWSRPRESNP